MFLASRQKSVNVAGAAKSRALAAAEDRDSRKERPSSAR